MLGLDLAAWNTLMWLSLGAAALAAIAIFVTTRVVISLQDQEASDRAAEFAAYRVEAGREVSALNARAKEAELETAQLKSRFAWRTIPDEAAAALIEKLSKLPSSITIEYAGNDPETEYFAAQISNVFDRAKWHVTARPITISGNIFWGMFVPGQNSGAVKEIRDAFGLVGIHFDSSMVEGRRMSFSGAGIKFGDHAPPSGPLITIGPKKPL